MGLLSILDEAGVSVADIDKAVAESVEVRAAIMEKARDVQEYWKSIAPVAEKAHTLKSGYVVERGEYRDSIRVRYLTSRGFAAEVISNSFLAHWLEYGSSHNPEHGYAAKVRDHFNM